MSKSRVCFLNRCYWPDAEATGQLLTQLCEYLAPRWDVTAVVGQPNFALDASGTHSVGSTWRNEVRIERLKHLTFPKRGRAGRLANLLSFTNQVRRWGRKSRLDADILVCETDPFFLPIIARRIARRSQAKLVFYLQDIYPDIAVALQVVKEGAIAKLIRSRLHAAYADADAIVVLDEDMRDRLVDWGIDRAKICIVPNWVDCDVIRPVKTENAFRLDHGIDDRFVVMHSGNMGMTQRLDVLLYAMRDPRVAQSLSGNGLASPLCAAVQGESERAVPLNGYSPGFPTDAKEILLAFVGGGAKRASLEAAASALPSVRFWDYQPQDRLAESLSAADLHVISMDERITGCIAPSKLYGILGSGTPILAIVPRDSAVWRFVRDHSLGWTAEPGDIAAIANAMVDAANCDPETMRQMGETGRRLAETQYDRVQCCQQFETILSEVVGC